MLFFPVPLKDFLSIERHLEFVLGFRFRGGGGFLRRRRSQDRHSQQQGGSIGASTFRPLKWAMRKSFCGIFIEFPGDLFEGIPFPNLIGKEILSSHLLFQILERFRHDPASDRARRETLFGPKGKNDSEKTPPPFGNADLRRQEFAFSTGRLFSRLLHRPGRKLLTTSQDLKSVRQVSSFFILAGFQAVSFRQTGERIFPYLSCP